MIQGLIGRKLGMTQVFDENGNVIPVTVIEAGPCYVTQIRTQESNGYTAVQLGFSETKPQRLTRGQLGHLKRNNLPALRYPAGLAVVEVVEVDARDGLRAQVVVRAGHLDMAHVVVGVLERPADEGREVRKEAGQGKRTPRNP